MFQSFRWITRSCFALVATFLVAENVWAQPVLVQQAQSHIDERGCLVLEAMGRVEEPMDDLFNVMARPEAIFSHSGPYSVSPRVFVGFPFNAGTYVQNPSNSWAVTHPSSKILELTAILGRSGALPRRWIEYGFDWKTHVISQRELGTTEGWKGWTVNGQAVVAQYVLSPFDDSTTTVGYSITQCFTEEDRKKVAQKRSSWTDFEKDSLRTWLTAAATECEWVRSQHFPQASAAATPLVSPAIAPEPTPTATPFAFH